MHEPGPWRLKAVSAIQYVWVVVQGFFRIARNADDPRVR
jgi:hypothetical protein